MESPYPWRALEDAPDPVGPASRAKEPPGAPTPVPGGVRATADAGRHRVLAVAGLAAAAVAAFATIALVVGGTTATTLVLPGDAGTRAMVDGVPAAGSPQPGKAGTAAGATTSATQLVVDVAGAVRRPGVYRLAAGSRVVDAVTAAGGYGPRVDAEAASRINLAAALQDGAQVRIPSRDDAAARGEPAASGAPAASGTPGGAAAGDAVAGGGGRPVNLNTASADELDTLPGVGPATAAKILAARAEAAFASVDELRSRGVVGEAAFRKLQGLVTVGP